MSAIYTGGFMAQEDTAKGMSMVQRPMNGGVQRQYKFSNGYGASVKGYLDEGELVYYLEKIRCLPTPI